MPKKATKAVLALIKKAGIKPESEELDKLEEILEDDLELSAEEFLGSDEIILTKDEHRELKDDLTKLRSRAKTAEGEAKELRDAMDAGDSDNARKATQYKKKLEELEPVLEKLQGANAKTWAAAEQSIPDEVKKEFHFAEKDKDGKVTKDLTTDQMIHNLNKFEEYSRIGVIKSNGSGEGDPPREGDPPPKPGQRSAPRVPAKQTGGKLTTEQMDKMGSSELIEQGYSPRKTTGGDK